MMVSTVALSPRLETLLTSNLERAHDAMDMSVHQHANLIAIAMKVRTEAGVSGTVGQDELMKLAAGLNQVIAARATFIEGHSALRSLGMDLGLITGEGGVVVKNSRRATQAPGSVEALAA